MKFLNKGINKENIMLLDMIYHFPQKENDRVDCLDIIYKDIDTGEKYLHSIENPEIDIYFIKEQYRDYDYTKTFTEINKCEKHTCQYKKLPWYIANEAGEQYINELKRLISGGRYSEINKIHTYPYVFGSDISIDTFYRAQWMLEYNNDRPKPLTKMYLDIEVDIIGTTGFISAENASYPINAVTIADDTTNSVYTFLLNNKENSQIQEFVDDIDNFIDNLHVIFDESYGELSYYIYMYDDERDLLVDLFKLINTLKRDYCMVYNGMNFDIPYIIERMKKLKMNPKDVMCHKDFKYKNYKIHDDKRTFKIEDKGSFFTLSSYTKFIDQMILYAATRKGQGELPSNALTVVAKAEIGDEKLDYSDEADIKTLPYINYRKFVIYNIKDVLLQMGIERKVKDLDNLYIRSQSNCVNIDKVFKSTVFLKTRAYYEYLLQGNILGNNINVFSMDDAKGFTGAIVGNPLLNDFSGIDLFGHISRFVFDNVIDMDFAAMYPHIIISFNIERHTMIAKLIIPDITEDKYDHIFITDEIVDISVDEYDIGGEHDEEEKEANIKYDSGKDFVDNYLSGDTLSIGTKWFNLPDICTIDNLFKEEFKDKLIKKIDLVKYVDYFPDEITINIERG